jgi:hypothetical protein
MFAEGSEFFPVFANGYRLKVDLTGLKSCLGFAFNTASGKPQSR